MSHHSADLGQSAVIELFAALVNEKARLSLLVVCIRNGVVRSSPGVLRSYKRAYRPAKLHPTVVSS